MLLDRENWKGPLSIVKIEPTAFEKCSSLTGIHVASENPSYISVEGVLFDAGQTLLHTYPAGKTGPYSIPSSVISIGNDAFHGAAGLTSVTIPDGVTGIGRWAFYGCNSLTDVYYGGSESQWKQIEIGEDNYGLLNANIHYNSAPKVMLSPQKLTVNGKAVECEKYNIDGSNYFKLRDLAYLLSGTGSQFGVGYDGATNTVVVTTGEAYKTVGGELEIGEDKSSAAKFSGQTILIDGKARSDLKVYNIGGNNFFQLRELGAVLGFEVDYNSATNTAIVHSST